MFEKVGILSIRNKHLTSVCIFRSQLDSMCCSVDINHKIYKRLKNKCKKCAYLLCVILSQSFQLLTFIMFDTIQHLKYVLSSGFLSQTTCTAIHAYSIDDIESVEYKKMVEKSNHPDA